MLFATKIQGPLAQEPTTEEPEGPTPEEIPPAETPPVEDIPPPDFLALAQKATSICRIEPNDPVCVQARSECRRLRGTPQASLPAVQQLCAALKAPGASSLVLGIIGAAAASRTRERVLL